MLNVCVPLLPLPTETLKLSQLELLAGAPGHAPLVHSVAVWSTPLWLVHVTALPVVPLAVSGLKQ